MLAIPENPIVLAALSFAILILFLGGWGVLFPHSIIDFIESWGSKLGLWLAVVLRLGFSVVLWFVAPDSRTPRILQALAVLVGASGVVLPILGYTRFNSFIQWWAKLPSMVMRAWCLVGVTLGLFVFWSVLQPITVPVQDQRNEYRINSSSGYKMAARYPLPATLE